MKRVPLLLLGPPLLLGLLLLAQAAPQAQAAPMTAASCPVARELAVKAIDLFGLHPDRALAALERAYADCPDDEGVGYNLGLALFQNGQLERARDVWAEVLEANPDHLASAANLAWTQFELGDDESAHLRAFEALKRHPGNLALAHTKVYALFRMGRYLEAYDWLRRANLDGARAQKWREQSVRFVVETLWRKFRRGDRPEAVSRAVNLLVREYPDEPAFVAAKDQLVMASVDPQGAEIPYAIPLPPETWPKTGNVDDRRFILDDEIVVQPPLADWLRRSDAYGVFVGVSQYRRVRGRHFADRDAVNLSRLLTTRGFFMDDPDHVRVRTDAEATLDVMRRDLEWLILRGRLNPNAMLLFQFSGHGFTAVSEGGEVVDLLLAPREVSQDPEPGEGISLRWLKQALESLPNQEVVVLIDACFNRSETCALRAPGETPPIPPSLMAGPRAWAMAALAGDAGIFGPGRQRAFTYFLLKGLLGAADGADSPSSQPDGWVDFNEAVAFAQEAASMGEAVMAPFVAAPAAIRLSRAGGAQ